MTFPHQPGLFPRGVDQLFLHWLVGRRIISFFSYPGQHGRWYFRCVSDAGESFLDWTDDLHERAAILAAGREAFMRSPIQEHLAAPAV